MAWCRVKLESAQPFRCSILIQPQLPSALVLMDSDDDFWGAMTQASKKAKTSAPKAKPKAKTNAPAQKPPAKDVVR